MLPKHICSLELAQLSYQQGTIQSPGKGMKGEDHTWSFIMGPKDSFLPVASAPSLCDSGFLKNNEMKASLRKSAVGLLHTRPNLTETIPESPVANTKSCMGDFLEGSQGDQVMENLSQGVRGGPLSPL